MMGKSNPVLEEHLMKAIDVEEVPISHLGCGSGETGCRTVQSLRPPTTLTGREICICLYLHLCLSGDLHREHVTAIAPPSITKSTRYAYLGGTGAMCVLVCGHCGAEGKCR